MFEEQFSVLFQTVESLCSRIDFAEENEQAFLRRKLTEIHELGVSWLDQWMALEEKLTDAFDKLGEIKQKLPIGSRTSLDQTLKIRYAPEPANVQLESIVFDMTNQSEVALRKGMGYFDLLMFEEATESLEHAVPATDEPAARLFLAASYTALGRLSEGKSELESVKAHLKNPTLTCAGSEIEAVICLREGNLEGAIRAYLDALAAMPAYSDAWFNLGACYLAVHEPVAAERMLLHVLKRDAGDREAVLLYIMALVQQGKSQDAFFKCEAACEAFPDNYELLVLFSYVCQLTDHFQQGEGVSRSMMEKYPNQTEGYLHASWYAFRRGDYGSARVILIKLLSLWPNHATGLIQLAILDIFNPDQAKQPFSPTLPVDEPYDDVLAIVSGIMSGDEKKIGKAISSKNISVRKLALYTSATLLMKKGMYQDAMQYLLSANTVGERNYAILAALHETALRLGRKDEAEIFLEHACLAEKQDLLKCH